MNSERPGSKTDVSDLLAAYKQRPRIGTDCSPRRQKANRVFLENHRIYKLLRESAEGRAGIAALMTHPMTGVRLTAAAHSLAWSPSQATSVLETIRSGPGLHSVSARYTFIAFQRGELDHDW